MALLQAFIFLKTYQALNKTVKLNTTSYYLCTKSNFNGILDLFSNVWLKLSIIYS